MNEDLKVKLTELGFTEEQIVKIETEGVTTDGDLARLNADQIKAITGVGLVTAMKVAEAFALPPVVVDTTSTTAFQNILPALPDDTSFIEMLKVGGILKVDRTNVIAAMRAAIASRVGLYDLPDKLFQRMEQFAEEQGEPAGDTFYKLQRQLTERRYGDILSALGTTGTFVNERRKKETLRRLHEILWPALRGFNEVLGNWVQVWSNGAANPATLMMAMAMSQGSHGIMPPGMMQPPDTSALRDEGESVINQINKVFAGTGIPVARALAYDAMRIRDILEDPNLPSTVGAANRDQMLKMLGVDVGSDFVRLEQNVTRFAVGIMEIPKVSAGNEELTYFSALYSLGAMIPWDKLTSVGGTVSSSHRPGRQPALVAGDSGWDGSEGGGLYKSER